MKAASKRAIQKNSCEAAGDLISNKIADKITKVPKPSTRQHKVVHIELKVKKKT